MRKCVCVCSGVWTWDPFPTCPHGTQLVTGSSRQQVLGVLMADGAPHQRTALVDSWELHLAAWSWPGPAWPNGAWLLVGVPEAPCGSTEPAWPDGEWLPAGVSGAPCGDPGWSTGSPTAVETQSWWHTQPDGTWLPTASSWPESWKPHVVARNGAVVHGFPPISSMGKPGALLKLHSCTEEGLGKSHGVARQKLPVSSVPYPGPKAEQARLR